MAKSEIKRPWQQFADGLPPDLAIPSCTMVERLDAAAADHPNHIAIDYLGKKFNYVQLIKMIDTCACALIANGVKNGDSVIVSLPNIPNAIIFFYALNRIGAKACMTHPLSSATELTHYVTQTSSKIAITIDALYGRFSEMLDSGLLKKLIIAHIPDYLPAFTKIGYALTKGRKIKKVPPREQVVSWDDFMREGDKKTAFPKVDAKAGSVVLFSGGTTQLPKGIVLSSYNFNALAVTAGALTRIAPGDSVMTILPVFHGFGLGLCVHTCMTAGVKNILIPEFSAKSYIANLIKHKPSFIAGVPTLFEAIMRDKNFKKASFENLKGAYSGGDSLYPGIKAKFDEMLKNQGSKVELKEGYGLTETVTACIISPDRYKENSMGIPLPNALGKIVQPGTQEEVPYGQEGEICIASPAIMLGYLNDDEATWQTLQEHEDGYTWLHTGDLGIMDEEGYFYFKNRIKRILKVSGMSVYPVQVERVLENHPNVFKACVIGVPDDYQMTSIKAFVVLESSCELTEEEVKKSLLAHCNQHLIKWSVPKTIEIIKELPTTLIGKVAYTVLEQEEMKKRMA